MRRSSMTGASSSGASSSGVTVTQRIPRNIFRFRLIPRNIADCRGTSLIAARRDT